MRIVTQPSLHAMRRRIGDTYGQLILWENQRRRASAELEVLEGRYPEGHGCVRDKRRAYARKLQHRRVYEETIAKLNAKYFRRLMACGGLTEGIAGLLDANPTLLAQEVLKDANFRSSATTFGNDARRFLKSEKSSELFSDVYLKAGDALKEQAKRSGLGLEEFLKDEKGQVNVNVISSMIGYLFSIFSFIEWFYKTQNVVRLRQWSTTSRTYRIDKELKTQMDEHVEKLKRMKSKEKARNTFGFVFGEAKEKEIIVYGFLPLDNLFVYVNEKRREKGREHAPKEEAFAALCDQFVEFLEGRQDKKEAECRYILKQLLDGFLGLIRQHKPGVREAGRDYILCSDRWHSKLRSESGDKLEPFLRSHLLGVFYYRDKLLKLDFPKAPGDYADSFLKQMKQVAGFVPQVMPRLIFVETHDYLMLHDFCAAGKIPESGSPGIVITMNEEKRCNCIGWNSENRDIERIRFIDDRKEEMSLWVKFLLDETSKLGTVEKRPDCK